jgi:hypothetical protein
MRHEVLALSLAVGAACRFPERPGPPGVVARDVYLESVCRLLADDRCAVEAARTCEEPPDTFDARRECERWLAFEMSTCVEVDAGFAALHGDALACAEALDGFDCEEDGFCDAEGLAVHERGACAPIAEMIAASCGDTGG